MKIEFLVQMRQSDKCGSVRDDEIFNLHLGSGTDPYIYTFLFRFSTRVWRVLWLVIQSIVIYPFVLFNSEQSSSAFCQL